MYSKLDKNINFYLSTFPAKINNEIFQNKGKILFCGHFWAYFVVFTQKDFFLKIQLNIIAVVPQYFKDTEQIGHQTKNNPSACKNHSVNLLNSFVRYTWFRCPMVYKAPPIFDQAHPRTIKITLSFPKFVSTWEKSADSINSFLWYSSRVPRPKRPCPFLTITTQKLLKRILAFLKLYQH